jgi:integrase
MKGTITKYRKKDGRLTWGYYYKIGAKQFTKTIFATKFDASKALDAALGNHQDADGVPRKGDTRTLAEYLPYWLERHAKLRCQPKTLERYGQLAGYLVRLLGSVPILDLKSGLIQEAVNLLQLQGGAPTKNHPQGRPLAPKTVHSTASMLYTCLGDAVRLEHIPANPMADGRVKLPKRPKANPAVMDAGALGAIFQAAEGTRLYPFVVTAACSGCRRGELLALTWPDLDFETGLMTVSKSLEQTKRGLRVKGTKSGKPRLIGLDEFALDALAAHREEQEQDKTNFGSEYLNRYNLVFCQPNGDFYSPDHVGTRTKTLLRKAGFPKFSLHSLRHSHASILLSNGTPLPAVSERLGHANQNITLLIYSHCLPADRKAASKLWHNALAEVISEDRFRKPVQNLEKSRKLAVND